MWNDLLMAEIEELPDYLSKSRAISVVYSD